MKNFMSILFAACVAVALAADDKALDIRPPDKQSAAPSGVEWENANNARLAAATADGVLAAIATDESAAMGLLAQVRGAYETDSLVARQIAAVSQWVMREDPSWFCFWAPKPSLGRRTWVNALVATAEKSPDAYVKMFCLDQLRWCGFNDAEFASRILKVGRESGDKAVEEFSLMVARELGGKAVGI